MACHAFCFKVSIRFIDLNILAFHCLSRRGQQKFIFPHRKAPVPLLFLNLGASNYLWVGGKNETFLYILKGAYENI